MTEPVEFETDDNADVLLVRLLRIAFVLVEIRDELLLPGRPDTRGRLADALRRRHRTRAFLGGVVARHRGGFCRDRLGRSLLLLDRLFLLLLVDLLRLLGRDDAVGLFGLLRRI